MKLAGGLAALLVVAACEGTPELPADGDDAGAGAPSADAAPGCPTDVFLPVATAPGPGAGYPTPSLSVTCDEDTMTVTANGVPTYTFVPVTPNGLAAQAHTYTITRHPTIAAQPTELPLLGYAGFAVNGAPFFGPNEAGMPADTAWGDPVYNGITDDCLGHTAMGGAYHYHALVEKCLRADNLVAEPWATADPDGSAASPILGYAADGFAIHGPWECTDAACTGGTRRMRSSWDRTGDPSTDAWDHYSYSAKAGAEYLDRCNGHVGPAGDYHYHATDGFPYVIGCFSGTPRL